MMNGQTFVGEAQLPGWVPDAARHYIAHTEKGQSIRALARENDCHPSTILRQVRRFESRRDDPLIDAALRALSDRPVEDTKSTGLTKAAIDSEAHRILRRLCEQGAVLAVSAEMDTAVVVRQTAQGAQLRTGVVDREIAQAMALKDWIACNNEAGKVVRYFITNAGRAALRRLTAEGENRAGGFAQTVSEDAEWDVPGMMSEISPARQYINESPLIALSRRREKGGAPFLSRDLVAAGERLREDYELAQMCPVKIENWDQMVNGDECADVTGPRNAVRAFENVRSALADLGPGLGDVSLRCCCFLEGLEVTERRMGWSARSGKIVLRIALQRLSRHYCETLGEQSAMIG